MNPLLLALLSDKLKGISSSSGVVWQGVTQSGMEELEHRNRLDLLYKQHDLQYLHLLYLIEGSRLWTRQIEQFAGLTFAVRGERVVLGITRS